MIFTITTFGQNLFNSSGAPATLRYVIGSGFNYTPQVTATDIQGSLITQGTTTGAVDTSSGFPTYEVDLDAVALNGQPFGEVGLFQGSNLVAIGVNATLISALAGLIAIEASLDGSSVASVNNVTTGLVVRPSIDSLPLASQANPNAFGISDRPIIAVTKPERGIWELAGGLLVGEQSFVSATTSSVVLSYPGTPPAISTKLYLSVKSGANKGLAREITVTAASSGQITASLATPFLFAASFGDLADVYFQTVLAASSSGAGIDQSNVGITGGAINGTPVGSSVPAIGRFTTLQVVNNATIVGELTAAGLNSTPIGITTPAAARFSTLNVSGLATLGPVVASSINDTPIGLTQPNQASFTTLVASGGVNLSGSVILGTSGANSLTLNSQLLANGNSAGLLGYVLSSRGPNQRPTWQYTPGEQVASIAPLARADGSALQEGDRYWNSATKQLNSWDATGSIWVQVGAGGGGGGGSPGSVTFGTTTSDTFVVNSTSTFSGPVTNSSTATFNGIATFNQALITEGNVTLGSNSLDTVLVNGTSTFSSPVTAQANVTLGTSSVNALTVNSTATFAAPATFQGNVTVGDASTDALLVNSAATFSAAVILSNNLTVQGSASFNGAVTLGDSSGDAVSVTGTATFAQNATFSGSVAVNGGNVTTASTTASLFNTTATTLNVGQAATTVSLGATSGTTTIRNNLAGLGTLTLTNGAVIQGVTLGRGAGAIASNTAVGASALAINTTGSTNTSVGASSLAVNSTGQSNSALGNQALGGNTTGSQNTAVGFQTLLANVTGSGNTAVGNLAAAGLTTAINSTSIGTNAFQGVTSATNCFAIGNNSGKFGGGGLASSATLANVGFLGDETITEVFVNAALSIVSDIRDKGEITPLTLGLPLIEQLEPITFKLKVARDSEETHGRLRYGFSAQQVAEQEAKFSQDNVIVDTRNEEKYKFRNDDLVAVLVNAVKELSAKVKALEAIVGTR